MSYSKWIDVSSLNAPVGEVAVETLSSRVERVEEMLPLAAWEYESDIEHVHQLRTSCRRAAAALEAFRPLMSTKPKALRKQLRNIRRAAGPARDADVLLQRLEEEQDSNTNLDYVVARLHLQRDQAQGALVQVAEKSHQGKLKKALKAACESLSDDAHHDQRLGFRLFARAAMNSASQEVFQLTAITKPTIAQLHQLRIAGKRMRYSIELFYSAFPDELRGELYPMIEKLQDRLGCLNDHATAQSMFQHWLGDLPPGERAAHLAGRIVQEYEASKKVRRDFLDWWTTQQVAALESRLSALLHSSG